MSSVPGPADTLDEITRLIALSPAPSALVSIPSGAIRAANPPMLALLGLDPVEIPGALLPRALLRDPPAPPGGRQDAAAGPGGLPARRRFVRRDGVEVEALTACSRIEIQGQSHALVVVMEMGGIPPAASLKGSDEGMRAVLAAFSFDAVGVLDAEGKIVYASPSAENITGFSPEDLLEANVFDLIHPEDHAAAIESMGRAFANPGRVESGVFRFRHRSGGWRYCETAGHPITGDNGEPLIVINYRDVTERVIDRAEMEALAERFRRMFELSPLAAVLIRDSDGIITEANAAFLSLSGFTREEVVGKLTTAAFWPIEEERVGIGRALRAQGEVRNFPLRFRSRTGREVDTLNFAESMVVNGEVCVLGIAIDVTEQQAMEARVQQVEKLDAIARVAAGVAHDFNNVLGIIKLEAGVLGRNPSLDAEAREGLAEIVSATDRAARMTRQLLAFGRNQPFAPGAVDVREALEGVLSLLKPLAGRGVTLNLDLPRGLWPIRADPGQLDQVLVNLAVNARDAMDGKGTLTFRARNETMASDTVVPASGDYVLLSVSDTGAGMDALTLIRIFEPFFTTKPPGQGTGLGLAAVHGVVHQHGGAITVKSQPGAGATFTIYWPRAQ